VVDVDVTTWPDSYATPPEPKVLLKDLFTISEEATGKASALHLAKDHGRREARCKSTIAERLHANVELDLIENK
jgi:hypothetical protein